MRQETYRFALDEASAELRDILQQFEALRLRKEQIEKVVEALKPFLSLQTEAINEVTEVAYAMPEIEQPVEEPVQFTYMQVSGPSTEPVVETAAEEIVEPVLALVAEEEEASSEQVAYFRQPSADPFQRRIDDALWGWQQRPEGLLSPI
jgi:DNA-directed RNA polymerase subunit L